MKSEDITEALELLSSWGCKFEDTVFYEIYCKPNKSKIMKIEDLKGTKIYLSNEEDRVKFQEKVFSLGVEWRDGAPHEIVPDCPFYYISYNYKLTWDCATSSNFFISHPYKQTFLDDVLAIEEPKKEYEFQPFDKVLVRDSDESVWIPRFYSNRHRVSKDYPFEVISGGTYRQCIPYRGNEHLVGTNKDINMYVI